MDPFVVLGVPDTAGLDEVRAARRRLAKRLHPDHGGDVDAMRELNHAFDLAVKTILHPPGPAPPVVTAAPAPARVRPPVRGWAEQDVPSFTIAALPAAAFEALLIVTGWLGEVLVDEPPFLLEVHLHDPGECWCRLELIPEAGASMVGLTVAGAGRMPPPPLDAVRDRYIAGLNELTDWPEDSR